MSKKSEFAFAKLASILILLALLVWIIIWYVGLRNQSVDILGDFFRNIFK